MSVKLSLFRPAWALVCLAGLALAGFGLAGCGSESTAVWQAIDLPDDSTVQTAGRLSGDDTIAIATFNIQVFGVTKLQRPEVMDILARIVRRFDVVAVQELRSKDQTVIPQFLEMINAQGRQYDAVVGPRLGRTSSKEQYVYLFDTARIEVDWGSVYTVDDPEDKIHREPLVARFRVRGPPADQAFTFTLVNVHSDPDEAAAEMDALCDVFTAVQHNGSGEDDVILLGDFNIEPHRYGRLGQLPDMGWAITGETTNTRRSRCYDNIIFNTAATVEYTGESGVLDLTVEYGLTLEEALQVSDHLPVWAKFRVLEGSSGRFAETPRGPGRF